MVPIKISASLESIEQYNQTHLGKQSEIEFHQTHTLGNVIYLIIYLEYIKRLEIGSHSCTIASCLRHDVMQTIKD
ncbi:hypothetical protein HBA_0477 [Sodalis endosymbiont of Henestaris halophilus]|nr:hypothetical protein HBA_0477 [Sodalis endosymbiont of Henestaris halophilus]